MTGSAEPPIAYYPDFLSPAESLDGFDRSQRLAWARDEINMYGRKIPVPREECLYGDDLRYQYRGTILRALPWPDFLRGARDRIGRLSGFDFNFAVGNRYLTGKDSIGWHADDFPQIGKDPAIASLSLGSARVFKLTDSLEAPRDGKVSWTAHRDLAAGAAQVLLQEGRFEGPTPPLTAAEALDLDDVAAILAELHRRPVERQMITDEQHAATLAERGVPPTAVEIALGLYRAARAGEFATVDPALGALLGRRPMTLREVLAAGSDA